VEYGQKNGQPAVYQQGLTMLEQAQKYAPKYKGLETVMQDGKPVLLQSFENQAPQPMKGYQPKPDYKQVDTGGTVGFVDPLTSAIGPTFNKTVTPDATLSANTSMRGQDITMRGQNMTDARAAQNIALRKQELIGPDGPMTDDAIKNAAARYNIDGTLPPMGMGLTAAGYRSAILNEAARQAQDQGLTPDVQRTRQLENKASSSALSQVAKQEGMVGAFERNFIKNADLALQQSAKVDRTGVPIVNKWINAGKRAVTGDPDLSAFDAVVKATVNEYSKILSGSMGNQAMAEGEIKKVEGLLSAAQTPQQVQAVISMMKQETANRMAGFKEQKAEIVRNMRGGQETPRVIDFNSLPK
jgi:putative sterol carrier protein